MKLVIEHIEFTRGENPFKTLNIGKRAVIENWFKTWVPYIKYKIDKDLNIKVKKSLWLRGMNIIFLPDNLHVDGWLDLRRTNIISLPNNLYVKKGLDLDRSRITSLPDNLYVGGNLYISKTKITSLPDDLIVVGNIYKDF